MNLFNHAMKQTVLLSPVLSMITIFSPIAYAQSTVAPETGVDNYSASDKTGVSLGINVIANKSAYDIDDAITVMPSLFYDNNKVYARGSQLGGYLVNDNTNEIAGFIQPAGSNFDPDNADGNLELLDERKWSTLIGASYLRRTSIGGFRGQIATDISGRSDGTVAKLTYIAKLTPGKWTIYPSVGLEWVDKNYNEYYYGVSQKEAAKSGVAQYKPDSSISPYISVNGTYTINNDWDIFLGQNVNFLSDEQKDSPMVDDDVDYQTTLGVLYKF